MTSLDRMRGLAENAYDRSVMANKSDARWLLAVRSALVGAVAEVERLQGVIRGAACQTDPDWRHKLLVDALVAPVPEPACASAGYWQSR